jgi:lipopolysaccharide biosynthesis glycosyltransferase
LETSKNETAMLLDRNIFEEWMRRIMERFEKLESKIDIEKPEKLAKPEYTIDGEKLYDNQDLCFMLNCSKRTLQRYRVEGLLPCKRIKQKTYYLETDVMNFIREHLQYRKGKQ